MKFKNTQVFNIYGAMRGMRNPLESWDNMDSGIVDDYEGKIWRSEMSYEEIYENCIANYSGTFDSCQYCLVLLCL